jgi:cytochrome c oxidase assembly factor CtaG
MLMLIDTRGSSRRDERPVWEPNWRLWAWVAGTIVLFVAADSTPGVVSYVLVLGAVASACRAISVILPPLDGLRDYRQ